MENTKKFFDILSNGIFLLLLIFSLIFYKERVCYIDSAFQFFKLVNYLNLDFEAHRYSTFFIKIVPLFSAWFQLPLKVVMIVFSSWFIIWYYLIFLLIRYWFNDQKVALALALTMILCIENSFYHVVTETHQGLVYCLLFYSWLRVTNSKFSLLKISGYYFSGLLIIILCLFAHPVTIFPLIFLILLNGSEKKKIFSNQSLVLMLFIVASYLVKFIVTPANSYEGKLFGNLADIFRITSNFFTLYSYDYFFNKKFENFYIYYLLLLLPFLIYVILERKSRNLIPFLAVAAFLIITIVVYREGDSDVMMEKNFYPLSIFLAVLFVEPLFSRYRLLQFVSMAFFILITITGIVKIFKASEYHTKRLNYLSELLASTEDFVEQKFIVNINDIDKNAVGVDWAVPFETLLLSSLDAPHNSKTLYIAREEEDLNLNDSLSFNGPNFYRSVKLSSLNTKYFLIKPSIPLQIKIPNN
jgi:hypothetical protein